MNLLRLIMLLVTAFLVVFWEAAFPGNLRWLKAQVDLLPALMVYASLRTSPLAITCLAVCGGLLFDSLSANPLAVTVLPLFSVGTAMYLRRDLILRDQPYAQFVMGGFAGAITPLLTVVVLLTAGESPLLGWGSLWQWFVMALASAGATPIFFFLFEWAERAFAYQRSTEPAFRPDREIQRGRK